MEHLDKQLAYTANRDAFGRVRIWSYSPENGIDKLLLDKPNLITVGGADIVARALTGAPNTAVNYIYVGYNAPGVTTVPSVTVNDDITSFTSGNYARLPLAFSPSFANETGYNNNLVYFTSYLTGTGQVANNANIVSLGLVNAADPANASLDKLFSRISFSAVTYASSYGLAITWGLTFRSA